VPWIGFFQRGDDFKGALYSSRGNGSAATVVATVEAIPSAGAGQDCELALVNAERDIAQGRDPGGSLPEHL